MLLGPEPASPTVAATPLSELAVGERGVVRAVRCPRPVRRRLLELGLLPGTPVQVLRRAPLGDPIELRLRGYSLSIRSSEASAIEVESLPQVEAAAVPQREEKRAT
ncbi:MAG TPA: FeoA domain-containing protein [Polyangiaceae bacterium LLY-WYZ-15_(1-7)]|nr:iron transporter FeoA [Myxococcales bacterium]MAT25868.1 iron transporter FeoA [Sandaracinus sp.]HJK89768.1 FeoA domain-containing protein [Polyangiaceae bacterium LLY-WYZ-15_(1-7)]MBJ74337.1 iron transporter FeoA [Sandaracinus sp.]HJL04898.1 FeoA domain-containing protein [Polyangiaceae bacterium LLY-WYZ-15_(1-7)]